MESIQHSIVKFRQSSSSTKVVPSEIDNNKSDKDISQSHDQTSVYKALRPLHISLSLGGLIFKKDFSKTGIKRHITASHAYSFVVLIFISINVVRWLTMFQNNEKFGTALFAKIIFCTFGLQTWAHYVAFFIASESYERLPEFFLEWEKIRTNDSRSLTYISRLSSICTVILWIIVICNVGASVYLAFFTPLSSALLVPWDENFECAFVIRIINTIQQVYLSISWVASSAMMFIICKNLAQEFNKISLKIKQLSGADHGKLAADFEVIRQHHQKLCNLVMNADDILSMQVACSLSGSLLLSCLTIYIILYYDPNVEVEVLLLAMNLFWALAPLGKVVMDCVSGTILNEAVGIYEWRFWFCNRACMRLLVQNRLGSSIFDWSVLDYKHHIDDNIMHVNALWCMLVHYGLIISCSVLGLVDH